MLIKKQAGCCRLLHFLLFRKHPGQIYDTVIQNIHAQLVAGLTEICRFIITICQGKDLDAFAVRVHNPVFPDAGLLIEVELCESVMPMSPGGKDLHHQIGRAPAPDVIQFIATIKNIAKD